MIGHGRYAVLLAMALAAGGVLADNAGTVKTVKGSVTIERAGQKVAAGVGTPVRSADRVVTGADSSVGIMLRDNTMLSAGPGSAIDISKYAFDPTTHTGVLNAGVKRGTLAVISGKIAAASPQSVSFTTPTATLGVRGTEFIIDVADRGEQ